MLNTTTMQEKLKKAADNRKILMWFYERQINNRHQHILIEIMQKVFEYKMIYFVYGNKLMKSFEELGVTAKLKRLIKMTMKYSKIDPKRRNNRDKNK